MKKLTTLFVVLSLASMLGGCSVLVRSIRRINDHPTQNVVFLESTDLRYRYFWFLQSYYHLESAENVFWQCVERNGSLECQRQCGPHHQSFQCPRPDTASALRAVFANVR
jgi:hypothetical protein